jgi:hypothetical protein
LERCVVFFVQANGVAFAAALLLIVKKVAEMM